ncbi:O-antigen/teichoic acid export membrane protein [Devosia subaequoris]|uniref:O-antigen/teichoic acid export membrane protein n=1 Tax=Devosia subaequoris TaxID=395930 RepID=A0A7W6IQ57_9HYPH|nr:hypothetical protein [Devosia subaequoris]MBB4053776.1 O-antigen/teichoic acid export membrane protein [Devosia subaequoris]MCP1211027.1 hypothetical protein [Devosia subaequoris]
MSILTTAPGKFAALYRNSGLARWSLASQAVTSGANFLLVLLLVRAIGIEQFGRYSLYYLIALNISGVLQALIALPAVSISALETGLARSMVIGRATTFYLIYGLAAFAALALVDMVLAAINTDLNISFMLAGGFFLALAMAEYVRRVLFLLESVRLAFALDVLRYALTFLACWYAIAATPTAPMAEFFVWAVIGGHSAAVVMVVAIPQVFATLMPRWRDMRSLHSRLWRSGGWLSGTSILQFCNEHLFVVAGFAFVGPQAIGLVRASQTIVGLVNPILYSLENFHPLQIGQRLAREGKGAAMQFFRRQATVIGAAFALLLLATAILAQPLLDLIVGPQATGGAWILQALCLMEFFLVLRVLLTFPFRAVEDTKPVFVAILMGAIASSAAVYPLLAAWQVGGLLIGVIGAQFVTVAVLFGFSVGTSDVNSRGKRDAVREG